MVEEGNHVEIAPHYDLWMQGARYGTVRSIKDGVATVKMDHWQVDKLQHFPVEDLKKTR